MSGKNQTDEQIKTALRIQATQPLILAGFDDLTARPLSAIEAIEIGVDVLNLPKKHKSVFHNCQTPEAVVMVAADFGIWPFEQAAEQFTREAAEQRKREHFAETRDRWLSVRTFSTVAGLHRSTIHRMIKSGRLVSKTENGHVLIASTELENVKQ